MSELKPCPFCGKQPLLWDTTGLHNYNSKAPTWDIGCNNEECLINVYKCLRSEEDAIKAWNTRAPTGKEAE